MVYLIVFAGLSILFFVLAVIAPKSYSISRQIVIDRDKTEVFNYIRFLKNQDYFNKWVMQDPELKKAYSGIDGTTGFVYAWEGNKKAGKGEQEIKRIVEGRNLDVEVRFEKPFRGTAFTPFSTESVNGHQTMVSWGMSSRMKFPMNIILLFVNMDKALGGDLQESLGMLKRNLEKGG